MQLAAPGALFGSQFFEGLILMGIQMKQGQYRGGVAWHACIFAFLALAAARSGAQVQRAALPPKAGEVTLNLDPTGAACR